MNKIDLVFPYVDCNEPEWQKVYKEERRKNDLPTNISQVRFREWNNLKYLFRSIEKFTPWIGNVYMIVSNKEQVPEWVDTDEVHIVLHKDIIPEQFLPTFNSTTIEMFLGNIKGLSERFIYANDDIYFLKPLKEEDFFENAVPKLSVKTDKGLETMFKKVEWKCLTTIANYFGKKLPDPVEEGFLKLPHTFIPMSTETVRIISKLFKPEIYSSISQFRKAKNFNQYIYTYYQLFSGSYLESKRSYRYTSFKDSDTISKAKEIAKYITEQKYDSICINDVVEFKNDSEFEMIKTIINSALEKILPDKSKYELEDENIEEKKLHIFKWLNKIGATFQFKKEEEIRMFVEGVIDLVERIRKTREDGTETSSEGITSEDSSFDESSKDN